MIAAGKLRDRIKIVPSATTQNRAGTTVETFDPASGFLVWAEVRAQGNAETIRNGLNATDTSYAIRIRYRTDVNDSAQIVYRDRTLDIFSVVEGGRREWLDIVAKERAA